MKLLSAFFMIAMAFSTVTNAANTLDSEKPVKSSEAKTFRAVYKGLPIIAWTGDENNDLSQRELYDLAAKRAHEVCRYFGFQTGNYDGVDTSLAPYGLMIVNGQLMQIEPVEKSTGILNDIGGMLALGLTGDMGRAFENLTCVK